MPTVPSSSSGASGSTAVGAELDYVEITANATTNQTVEASATTLITGSAVTYDGATTVLIEFFTQRGDPSALAAGGQLVLNLYEDGTDIGRIAQVGTNGAGMGNAIRCARRRTPSAGSHTYSIRGWVSAAGTAAVQAGAGGAATTMPAFIRVTRVA